MRIFPFVMLLLLLLSACSSTKKMQNATTQTNSSSQKITSGTSEDDTYGFDKENPIKVGGGNSGPANERAYLNSLTGPNGEPVRFQRLGSCCAFKTPNGLIDGMGLLDRYEVTYEGLEKPVILYLNMYDAGKSKAPKGFRIKG